MNRGRFTVAYLSQVSWITTHKVFFFLPINAYMATISFHFTGSGLIYINETLELFIGVLIHSNFDSLQSVPLKSRFQCWRRKPTHTQRKIQKKKNLETSNQCVKYFLEKKNGGFKLSNLSPGFGQRAAFTAEESRRQWMQSSILINTLPQVHCVHGFISFNYSSKLALKPWEPTGAVNF